jgi:hypothetical protein
MGGGRDRDRARASASLVAARRPRSRAPGRSPPHLGFRPHREDARAGDGRPYAHTRNPLYLGSTLMAAGIALASASPWAALAGAVYFLRLLSVRHPRRSGVPGHPLSRHLRALGARGPAFLPRLTPAGRARPASPGRASASTANGGRCWPCPWPCCSSGRAAATSHRTENGRDRLAAVTSRHREETDAPQGQSPRLREDGHRRPPGRGSGQWIGLRPGPGRHHFREARRDLSANGFKYKNGGPRTCIEEAFGRITRGKTSWTRSSRA